LATFLAFFLQGTSVAFSTWGLLNFAIPEKTCNFAFEFRRHSGGVRKDFIEKGVIEIIFLVNNPISSYTLYFYIQFPSSGN
jgi:hypothetical protein